MATSTLASPVLLKIDVDGVEVRLLQGAQATLLCRDYVVVVDTSMGDDLPRLNRVFDCMSAFGLDVHDVVDVMHRKSDWHMWQIDLVFVKKDSPLWGGRTIFS